MIEKDYIYEMDIEVADLDENGILKPNAYQALFARLAEKHLVAVDLNVDVTLQFHLAWALVSMVFEINNTVKGCMKLFATTWHSQRRGPFFRRELVFKNKDGTIMFQGSTFSVLLDVESRSVYRKKELPFHVHAPIEEFTCTASPTYKGNPLLHEIERRIVRNSHIDWLGHMNNCKYGEFAHDILTDKECKNLDHLTRMEIYFISELRKNDSFSLWKLNEYSKQVKENIQITQHNQYTVDVERTDSIDDSDSIIINNSNKENPIFVKEENEPFYEFIHVRGINETCGTISFDISLTFS